MGSRSVSRCVAIASHGKRCQQSRFKGSPFCWHHMQSRKLFAPSRLGAAVRPPVPARAEPLLPEPERLVAVPPPPAVDPVALGTSLVEALGPDVATEVLGFAQDGFGILTLLRAGGPVQVRRPRPPLREAAAEG